MQLLQGHFSRLFSECQGDDEAEGTYHGHHAEDHGDAKRGLYERQEKDAQSGSYLARGCGKTASRSANMGGEDFSWYLQEIPGCYVRLGARLAGAASYPAHSSRFQIDEGVLAAGAAWFAAVATQAGAELAENGVPSMDAETDSADRRESAEAS